MNLEGGLWYQKQKSCKMLEKYIFKRDGFKILNNSNIECGWESPESGCEEDIV